MTPYVCLGLCLQVATYLSLSSGFAFLSALDSLGREKKKASEAGGNVFFSPSWHYSLFLHITYSTSIYICIYIHTYIHTLSIHTYVCIRMYIHTYVCSRTLPTGLGFRYVYVAPAPLEALFFLVRRKKGLHTLQFAAAVREAGFKYYCTKRKKRAVACTHLTRCSSQLQFARHAWSFFVLEKPVLLY